MTPLLTLNTNSENKLRATNALGQTETDLKVDPDVQPPRQGTLPPPPSPSMTEAEEIAHGLAMAKFLEERLASGVTAPPGSRKGLITSSNVKEITSRFKESQA